MKTALMLMVGEDGTGQLLIDGRAYMVRSSWDQPSWTVGGSGGSIQRWDIHVTATRSLDEEAQRRRIEGLERELDRERERLTDIRAALGEGSGGEHE